MWEGYVDIPPSYACFIAILSRIQTTNIQMSAKPSSGLFGSTLIQPHQRALDPQHIPTMIPE